MTITLHIGQDAPDNLQIALTFPPKVAGEVQPLQANSASLAALVSGVPFAPAIARGIGHQQPAPIVVDLPPLPVLAAPVPAPVPAKKAKGCLNCQMMLTKGKAKFCTKNCGQNYRYHLSQQKQKPVVLAAPIIGTGLRPLSELRPVIVAPASVIVAPVPKKYNGETYNNALLEMLRLGHREPDAVRRLDVAIRENGNLSCGELVRAAKRLMI